jgi:leucyl/phenylalanyl-tRNA--protein transferase
MSLRLHWLAADPRAPFPPPEQALRDPDGLLAAGGDLHPLRLLNAYRQGIFPWFNDDQPILWWSPDPRTVFRTDDVHLARRFRRSLRSSGWIVRADTAFAQVVDACATQPRPGQDGTWITDDMRAAYLGLHRLGYAHSIEVYDSDSPGATLVGGLYGVAIGRMFFGESMVSLTSGGSKTALAALAYRLRQWAWPLIDAQVDNPHLFRMGAISMPRDDFLAAIAPLTADTSTAEACSTKPCRRGPWTADFGIVDARTLADA